MNTRKAFLYTLGVMVTVVFVYGGAAYARKEYTHSVTVVKEKSCAHADITFEAVRDRNVKVGHCAKDVLVHGETEVKLSCTWKKDKGIVLKIWTIRAADNAAFLSGNTSLIRNSQGDPIVFEGTGNVYQFSWESYGIAEDRRCAEWLCDDYRPGLAFPDDCIGRNTIADE